MNVDGTVKSSPAPVKIASGTNGGPTLTNFDFFGWSVANIGDINSDGISDIAVGAIYDDTNGTNRGAIYIITLQSDGTVRTVAEGGLGPVKTFHRNIKRKSTTQIRSKKEKRYNSRFQTGY